MPDRWIPVDSGEPPQTEEWSGWDYRSNRVLCTDGKEIFIGRKQQIDEEEPRRWIDAGSEGWELENITHWMPLPALPSKEK